MERKLRSYCLNPSHHTGGAHKARVFRAVLGIGRGDAEWLAAQILDALPLAPVTGVRKRRYTTWEVPIEIRRGSRRATVMTAWVVVRGRPPRLVSAYIAT